MITVLIPQPLRTLTNGESVLTAEGHNIRAVIRDLSSRYPELADRLMDGSKIGRGISLAINGDVVSTGLITRVPEGAEIAIVPQISGGRGTIGPPSTLRSRR
ncbi:MAG: MoaD/ThiS family protein [Chloroflexi bacterium]|nr:MoaD/ThiS family protein [Chloroflexota bacterium]MYJ57407.1 MoaD/ThiS family protein [Chloroflexota bacterium]